MQDRNLTRALNNQAINIVEAIKNAESYPLDLINLSDIFFDTVYSCDSLDIQEADLLYGAFVRIYMR